MSRLKGRTALVTGGLRGIGRGIAERFAEEGAAVMVADLDDAPEETGAWRYRRLDVTRAADWIAALDAIEADFGPLDILVNNAGTSRAGTIAETSEADWRLVMDTNLLSVFLGCHHAVLRMGTRGGSIINIASARGLRAGADQCAYSASKAAVLSLTQSTAIHCGNAGLPIRCNAICPGVVDTPLMRRHAAEHGGEATVRAMADMQVMRRLGTPREIADAALFLASDESSFVTGATLSVDGGFALKA